MEKEQTFFKNIQFPNKQANVKEATNMTKTTNPFVTINEAIQVLESLGAKPFEGGRFSSGATYPFPWGSINWQEQVINICVERVYPAEGSYHYEVIIHLNKKGFEKLAKSLQFENVNVKDMVVRESITDGSDRVSFGMEQLRFVSVIDTGEEVDI